MSLVPLVDVVFILLLFFMLSSTFIQKRQIPMDLPTQVQIITDIEVVDVELLSNNGDLLVAGQTVENFGIVSILDRQSFSADAVFAIRSASDVKVQALINLLDKLTQAERTKVALVE